MTDPDVTETHGARLVVWQGDGRWLPTDPDACEQEDAHRPRLHPREDYSWYCTRCGEGHVMPLGATEEEWEAAQEWARQTMADLGLTN